MLAQPIFSATAPAKASARSSTQAPNGLLDPQLILLETTSGVLVDVEVFVNARYGYDVRCEVVGEQGTLRLGEQEAADFRGRFATAYQRELDAWVNSFGIDPLAGASFGIMSFIAVALGGFGSVLGAALAGVLLGVVQGVVGLYFSGFTLTAALGIYLLVLIVRPQGLRGSR